MTHASDSDAPDLGSFSPSGLSDRDVDRLWVSGQKQKRDSSSEELIPAPKKRSAPRMRSGPSIKKPRMVSYYQYVEDMAMMKTKLQEKETDWIFQKNAMLMQKSGDREKIRLLEARVRDLQRMLFLQDCYVVGESSRSKN